MISSQGSLAETFGSIGKRHNPQLLKSPQHKKHFNWTLSQTKVFKDKNVEERGVQKSSSGQDIASKFSSFKR